MRLKKRELADLWIVVGIALSLAAYNLSVNLNSRVIDFFEPYTRLPMAGLLTNSLFFWTLGLLLLAYRRWRDSISREWELSTIMSSTGPEAVLVVGPNRAIRICNESVSRIFGYRVSEVIGQRTDLLYRDRRVDKSKPREIFEVLNQVGFHVGEAEGRRKDGTTFPLEIITTVLKGHQEGAVLLLQDITNRKNAEEALRKAKDEAEAATKAKEQALADLQEHFQRLKQLESLRDDLTHMIVHDMKSPIQILFLNLDSLKESSADKLDQQELRGLDDLLNHSRRLDIMVKSLLDVSRMESGSLPLDSKEGDLESCVYQVLKSLGTFIDSHRISVEAESDLLPMLFDHELIERVLLNLLINAMKHTPPKGTIRVSVSGEPNAVSVRVSDTGPGIPEEYREAIFEKFGRIETESHKKKGSTGLGLTFCKMAIEAHGGSIGVNSKVGEGSEFWFTLPCKSVRVAG